MKENMVWALKDLKKEVMHFHINEYWIESEKKGP